MTRQAEPLRYDVVAAAELTKTVRAAAPLPQGATPLGGTACAHLTRCELVSGELVVKGVVRFYGVVRVEQKAENLCAEAEFDFSETLPGMTQKALSTGTVCVTACQLTHDNGGQFAAVLEINVQACMPKEQEVVCAIEGKHTFTRQKSVEGSFLFGKFSKRITLEEDLELSARMPEIGEVLAQDCAVTVTEARAGDGHILVSGQATVWVTYSCGDDYEPVSQIADRFTFSELIEADNVEEDMPLLVSADVEGCTLTVLPNQENERRLINCEIALLFTASVYRNRSAEIIKDAYSDSCQLSCQKTTLPIRKMVACKEAGVSLRLRAKKPENKPPISRISAIFALPCTKVSQSENGYATFAGSAGLTILYLASGTGELHSFYCEVPFSEDIACTECERGGSVMFNPAITECLGVMVNAGEVEVRISMSGWFAAFTQCNEEVLTDVEEGEPLTDGSALCIYITQQGDTLWGIGKALGVSPSGLTDINEDLEEEPTPGTKVLIYRQLK